ncbi:uncharacterized protein KY384_006160 [Bacidia gigantensis]|uniref:uncharacterized protein n=1 Tax=Bacidia gigantensis TaxID=2732470 RepID=UPI001D03FDF4|nr:uncharacterized protein KY384_006160 [Bacidia gigantensis]KAG8529523.1 hypothetical protein KY384_006160 [Bacidia gigantensis]
MSSSTVNSANRKRSFSIECPSDDGTGEFEPASSRPLAIAGVRKQPTRGNKKARKPGSHSALVSGGAFDTPLAKTVAPPSEDYLQMGDEHDDNHARPGQAALTPTSMTERSDSHDSSLPSPSAITMALGDDGRACSRASGLPIGGRDTTTSKVNSSITKDNLAAALSASIMLAAEEVSKVAVKPLVSHFDSVLKNTQKELEIKEVEHARCMQDLNDKQEQWQLTEQGNRSQICGLELALSECQRALSDEQTTLIDLKEQHSQLTKCVDDRIADQDNMVEKAIGHQQTIIQLKARLAKSEELHEKEMGDLTKHQQNNASLISKHLQGLSRAEAASLVHQTYRLAVHEELEKCLSRHTTKPRDDETILENIATLMQNAKNHTSGILDLVASGSPTVGDVSTTPSGGQNKAPIRKYSAVNIGIASGNLQTQRKTFIPSKDSGYEPDEGSSNKTREVDPPSGPRQMGSDGVSGMMTTRNGSIIDTWRPNDKDRRQVEDIDSYRPHDERSRSGEELRRRRFDATDTASNISLCRTFHIQNSCPDDDDQCKDDHGIRLPDHLLNVLDNVEGEISRNGLISLFKSLERVRRERYCHHYHVKGDCLLPVSRCKYEHGEKVHGTDLEVMKIARKMYEKVNQIRR